MMAPRRSEVSPIPITIDNTPRTNEINIPHVMRLFHGGALPAVRSSMAGWSMVAPDIRPMCAELHYPASGQILQITMYRPGVEGAAVEGEDVLDSELPGAVGGRRRPSRESQEQRPRCAPARETTSGMSGSERMKRRKVGTSSADRSPPTPAWRSSLCGRTRDLQRISAIPGFVAT